MKDENDKPKRPRHKIRPEDNPKPFTKNYNGKNWEKWTEEKVHSILDRLEDWLLEDIPVFDKKGKQLGFRANDNCFYREFLYKERLFDSWISNMQLKFVTVKERMAHINDIQEHKLQILAAQGVQKENITKFILTNKYNWKEKSENENTNSTNIIWNESVFEEQKKDDTN